MICLYREIAAIGKSGNPTVPNHSLAVAARGGGADQGSQRPFAVRMAKLTKWQNSASKTRPTGE